MVGFLYALEADVCHITYGDESKLPKVFVFL